MTKSPAELERDAEDTRERIDDTVEALKEKMQPKELMNEASRIMSGTSDRLLTGAMDQLRSNPVPVALIGLGIAWLAIRQTTPQRTGYAYDRSNAYARRAFEAEHEGVSDRLKAGAEGARATISDAKARVQEGLGQASERVSEYARNTQTLAEDYRRVVRDRFDRTLDTEPLVLGALGLAVGAAIGASLPASTAERRYFGPAHDKAADAAKAAVEQVKDAADHAYEEAKDELHRQTGAEGEGMSLAEKATAIVGAGAQGLRDEIERHDGGETPDRPDPEPTGGALNCAPPPTGS